MEVMLIWMAMEGYGSMNSEYPRYEMDADEFAEHQAYMERRYEAEWD